MYLISRDSELIKTDKQRKLWKFFRDAHLGCLLNKPDNLSDILSEYFYQMYTDDGKYRDRFDFDIENRKCGHGFSFNHITNYLDLTDDVPSEDFIESKKFYKKLLRIVDNALVKIYVW